MTKSITSNLRRLTLKSTHHQHKLSAVVLYKGRIIAKGVNQMRTHPAILPFSDLKLLHAEMSALLRVKHKAILSKCQVVVYREDREGNFALASPCTACRSMFKTYGIREIFFSTKGGWKYEKL